MMSRALMRNASQMLTLRWLKGGASDPLGDTRDSAAITFAWSVVGSMRTPGGGKATRPMRSLAPNVATHRFAASRTARLSGFRLIWSMTSTMRRPDNASTLVLMSTSGRCSPARTFAA